MKNTDQVRQLLNQRINAAIYKAKRTGDFLIPLEDRHIVKLSIKETKEVLALLPEKKEPPCNFLRWCEWQNRNNCGGCVYYLH